MPELITINQIAKELKVSYHVARNRLNRTPECEPHKVKLDHAVVYNKEVLEIICKK